MLRRRDVIDSIEAAAIRAGISLDEGQRLLVDRLADLGVAVDRGSARHSAPRGLYIHGDAGRGKSWFFDELHVHDSGDAQLLTRLLEHAFRRRIAVLATSNYAPDDLLPNPIWHHTFERGIELITTNMAVHELRGLIDYRSTRLDHSVGFAAGQWTTTVPEGLRHHGVAASATVRGRAFPVIAIPPGELWATFAQVCDSPISTIEYLEWSRTYERWVITDVPLLGDANPEAQQRFINLVDVLVDADVRVTFVSTHDLATFVAGASCRPDGFRMASRLQLLQCT